MNDRPPFINALSLAYSKKRKNVVVLTGDILDLYWSPAAQRHLPLEQTLYRELKGKMLLLRLDAAGGISFYDGADRSKLVEMVRQADGLVLNKEDKLGDIDGEIDKTRHQPLPALVVLSKIFEAVTRLRSAETVTRTEANVIDLSVVIQHAGAIFPVGEFDRLNELDRQRLVTFLNMIVEPAFVDGQNLVVLVSDTRSELNSRIVALPHAEVIEIGLPTHQDRKRFVDQFLERHPGVQFEATNFIDDAAGLKLTGIEDLLEVAERSKTPVTRADVINEVNTRVKAEMGNVVEIVRPQHGPQDIIGYAATNAVIRQIIEDCEDPATAISTIIVSGPNGGGKTFQMEAWATVSGRVVIRLAQIRSQWFGGTEVLIEKLRLLIETYGKLMIMVDEAHAQFGSVHKSDTHETEKRLSGAIISMMSDPRYLGKVLWVLMTSRPDELDPDVKSRAPEQIAIFDLEGEERITYVRELFNRKGVSLSEEQIVAVVNATTHFSNRDFKSLLAKFLGKRKRNPEIQPTEILSQWNATTAIISQRRMQTLIAVEHCSYPQLLPASIQALQPEVRQKQLENLRFLHRS